MAASGSAHEPGRAHAELVSFRDMNERVHEIKVGWRTPGEFRELNERLQGINGGFGGLLPFGNCICEEGYPVYAPSCRMPL